jgi:hypothetical protein
MSVGRPVEYIPTPRPAMMFVASRSRSAARSRDRRVVERGVELRDEPDGDAGREADEHGEEHARRGVLGELTHDGRHGRELLGSIPG